MKTTFLLLLIAASLGACAYDGSPRKKVFNSPLCGAVKGYTVGYVAYGEGKMLMIPLSKVRAETVFVVGLKPLRGFGTADVTVTGTSANAGWIGAMAQHDSLPRGLYPSGAFEVGCVPSHAVGTSYKFEVKVEKGDVTNILDPRAEVVTW